jgi:hypothetical protein
MKASERETLIPTKISFGKSFVKNLFNSTHYRGEARKRMMISRSDVS